MIVRALAAAAVAAALLPAAAAAATVPHLGKVVVVVFENKEADAIESNAAAPTFARLGRIGARLTGYHGVTHPSLPNYLALVSGSTHGITSDCTDCHVAAASLADSLARAGRTWKAYAEGYPDSPRFAKKHVPFLYFDSVTRDPRRLARVVPYARFLADERARRLPDLSFVVPDLCHDMHDCSVAAGDAWLAGFLTPLLAPGELGRGGVVFVVFDEGTSNRSGGGDVAAYAVGPAVRPGSRSTGTSGHYGLLRTIEDGWGLPRLGQSAAAQPIRGIWRVSRKG